jgi:hypothetical protein
MSAPPLLPPDFPLPQVHRDLSPHIRPAPEVAQIRQLLSSHLRQLAEQPRISSAQGSTEEFERFLDLSLSKFPGARRNYLVALRENARVRKEHAAAVAALQLTDDGDDEEEEEEGEGDGGDGGDGGGGEEEDGWKRAYLDVLRLRRQHARLCVLREGVTALAGATTESSVGGLGGVYRHRPPAPPEELTGRFRGEAGEVGTGVEGRSGGLALELSKGIVCAYERVLEESEGLARVQGVRGGVGDRVLALRRIQAELLAWMEAALEAGGSVEGEEGDEVRGESPRKLKSGEEAPVEMEDVLRDVNAAYHAYLSSRAEILALVTTRDTTASPLPDEEEEREEEARRLLHARLDVAPAPAQPQVLKVLAASEHLLPLVHTQKGLLAAGNHHSGVLSKGIGGIGGVFAGSEDAVTAATGRGRLGGVFAGNGDVVAAAKGRGEEVVRTVARAEKMAWEFVAAAMGRLQEAVSTAGEVEELCKGGGRRKVRRAIPVRHVKAGEESESDEPMGVWGGLDGGVGVIGDGI